MGLLTLHVSTAGERELRSSVTYATWHLLNLPLRYYQLLHAFLCIYKYLLLLNQNVVFFAVPYVNKEEI